MSLGFHPDSRFEGLVQIGFSSSHCLISFQVYLFLGCRLICGLACLMFS